jgi:hypothetical protein
MARMNAGMPAYVAVISPQYAESFPLVALEVDIH